MTTITPWNSSAIAEQINAAVASGATVTVGGSPVPPRRWGGDPAYACGNGTLAVHVPAKSTSGEHVRYWKVGATAPAITVTPTADDVDQALAKGSIKQARALLTRGAELMRQVDSTT